jgi:hypothetical protein
MSNFYAILVSNTNEPNSIDKIRLQKEPGYTNMSREPREEGWLGTTDGIDQTALGVFDAAGARALLARHGVHIPDDVPIRHTNYMLGGSQHAEDWNLEFAYAYQGPWYNVPQSEIRWCSDPQVIASVRVATDEYQDGEFIILVTDEQTPNLAGSRCWYEADRWHGTKDEIKQAALALIGTTFDRGRLVYHR